MLAGELPKEQLGVKALGEYVLQITLSRPSPILLEQLAGPGAFPCNEAFFRSTRARYGQNASYILGNGPFVISSWDEEAVVLSPSKGIPAAKRCFVLRWWCIPGGRSGRKPPNGSFS